MNNNKTNNDEILELPDELVEKLVCKQLISPLYSENSIFIHQNFNANWFKDEHIKKLFKALQLYYTKYNKIPNKIIVEQILNNDKFAADKSVLTHLIDELNRIDETKYDKSYLQDTLINFTKRKSNVCCNIGKY